ncbi:GNAT superfamily N-acetyltransferase [Chitinivorax tropicus]|uniref:GNAT superfamily N-acetyltransferase n=1 Tax=Chitinivorax tropicus TaxID=714531 RepID=A0A840MPM1_9PROT|nr:GNAT family N-acetyltransferase [Chitinivorax tropicus]MBB5018692.1 GNAT superfamily N-acetyltransferase [Chitinivorax tropicus]
MYHIESLRPDHTALAADFYRQIGYRHMLTGDERLIGAWSDNRLVGCVRLCQEQGESVLRGMQILPAYQRQGLGTRLLLALTQAVGDQPCYCVPYHHLHGFYHQAGFRVLPLDQAPGFLSERVLRYRHDGLPVDLMARLPSYTD